MGLADLKENYARKKKVIKQDTSKSGIKYDDADLIKSKIETNVDKLYYALVKNKSMSLSSAASKLSAQKEEVETWAGVLDEQGLIELHYPAVGDPILRIKEDGTSVKHIMNKFAKMAMFAVILILLVVVAIVVLLKFNGA
jgi:hypothetical protein